MIFEFDKNFILSTKNTSYMFRVNEEGILEHLHYGGPTEAVGEVSKDTFRACSEKVSHMKGNTIAYTKGSLS